MDYPVITKSVIVDDPQDDHKVFSESSLLKEVLQITVNRNNKLVNLDQVTRMAEINDTYDISLKISNEIIHFITIQDMEVYIEKRLIDRLKYVLYPTLDYTKHTICIELIPIVESA